MAGNLKVIADHAAFTTEMSNAGAKLVVVDFTASWCAPCQRLAPKFTEFASKYPKAVFLKVDVDECQETAGIHSVTATPTFIFFRSKVKIDRISGADANVLETKIKQHYADDADTESGVAGHMDLSPFLCKNQSECLNQNDDHPLDSCLSQEGGFLQSDCDEQLIMYLTFNQSVKLHSIKVKAPAANGPKKLRIFINHPNTMDFDSAMSLKPVQEITLTEGDLDGTPVPLLYVKFQNVMHVTVFVEDNQDGSDVTQIDYFSLIGSPISTTNMTDFKRIAGKKGESH